MSAGIKILKLKHAQFLAYARDNQLFYEVKPKRKPLIKGNPIRYTANGKVDPSSLPLKEQQRRSREANQKFNKRPKKKWLKEY